MLAQFGERFLEYSMLHNTIALCLDCHIFIELSVTYKILNILKLQITTYVDSY